MKKFAVYILTVVLTAISTVIALDVTSAKAEATETVNTMADVVRVLVYENDNYTTNRVTYDDGEVQIYFSWDIMAREMWKEAFRTSDRAAIEQAISDNYRLSVNEVRDYVCNWHVTTQCSYKPYYSLMVGFG